jgi:hypothetical protein
MELCAMRFLRPRVAGVAALAVLAAVLLGSCDLREGHSTEYGSTSGRDGLNAETMGGELSV